MAKMRIKTKEWPELLTVTQAAAYAGIPVPAFKANEKFSSLIGMVCNRVRVRKSMLNEVIDAEFVVVGLERLKKGAKIV